MVTVEDAEDANEHAKDPRIILSLSHLVTAASLATCIFVTGNTAVDALSLTMIKISDQTISIGVFFWKNCPEDRDICWAADEKTVRLCLSITHGLSLAASVCCLWSALIARDALTLSRTYAANITLLSLASISQLSALFFLFMKAGLAGVSPAIALSLAPACIALTTSSAMAFLWVSGKRYSNRNGQHLSSRAEMGIRHDLQYELFGIGWDNTDVVKRAGVMPASRDSNSPEGRATKESSKEGSFGETKRRTSERVEKITIRPKVGEPEKPTRPAPRPIQAMPQRARAWAKQSICCPPEQPSKPAAATVKASGPPLPIPTRAKASPVAYHTPSPSWTRAYEAVHHLTSGPTKTTQELASEDLLEDLLVKAREQPPSALRIGRSQAQASRPSVNQQQLSLPRPRRRSSSPEADPSRSSLDIESAKITPPLKPVPIPIRSQLEQTDSSAAGTESLVDKILSNSSRVKPSATYKRTTSKPSTVPDLDKLVLPFSGPKDLPKLAPAEVMARNQNKPPSKEKDLPLKHSSFQSPAERPSTSKVDSLKSEADVFAARMKRPLDQMPPRESLDTFIPDAITEFSDPPAIVISKPPEESSHQLTKPKSKRLHLQPGKPKRVKALLSPGRDSIFLPKAKLLKQKATKLKDKKRPKPNKESKSKSHALQQQSRPVSESTKRMIDNWENLPFTPVPLSAAEADTGRDSFAIPLKDALSAAEGMGTGSASFEESASSDHEPISKKNQVRKEGKLRKRSEKSKSVREDGRSSQKAEDLSSDRNGNNSA